MSKRRFVTGLLMAGAIGWCSDGVADVGVPAGHAHGDVGVVGGGGAGGVFAECVAAEFVAGEAERLRVAARVWGTRSPTPGCVYKHIPWPDSEKAVRVRPTGRTVASRRPRAVMGRGEHYTHVSTATGASGDSGESARRTIC